MPLAKSIQISTEFRVRFGHPRVLTFSYHRLALAHWEGSKGCPKPAPHNRIRMGLPLNGTGMAKRQLVDRVDDIKCAGKRASPDY